MTTSQKILLSILFLLTCEGMSLAGNLDPPAGPMDPAGALYTANDLYNRLTSGAPGVKRTSPFVVPSAAPAPTGKTTDQIMAIMPAADNAFGATAAEVLSGKTFWCLRTDGTWGIKAGTMPNIGALNISPGTANQSIPAGYHNGTGVVTGDAGLIPDNIRSGVSIFGIAGNPNVVNTASGTATPVDILAGKKAWVAGSEVVGTRYPAPMVKTGQTLCYSGAGAVIPCSGTGQDGERQKGIAPSGLRFSDNSDGTVTDNATGLIWLQNANCLDTVGGIAKPSPGNLNWMDALKWSNKLATGFCGLKDGSTAGQWRLPNVKELQSLIDFGQVDPALPVGHPFTNVPKWRADGKFVYYWSSTTPLAGGASWPQLAWGVRITDGVTGGINDKADTYGYGIMVWPVKGGY